jgi:transcription antitermination factor NusG
MAEIGHDGMNAEQGLSAHVDEGCSGQFPWFALQVRTRHESSIGALLRARGYDPFIPLYQRRNRWSDRIKTVDAALFPGYLFCRLNLQNRLPVLMTPGVVQIVGFGRTPRPVDEDEITAIQTAIASGLPNQPWPFLQVGSRVQIECGPLRGLEGILLEFRGTQRLVLSVTLLQRSVAVEIDPTFVKSLPPAVRPQLHTNEYVSSTSSKKAVGILG